MPNLSLQQVLQDPSTPATVLLVILFDEFGTEMFDWEPDTLVLNIKDHWKVELPDVNKDKVWALITVLTTNVFFFSFEGFTHVCNALSGSGASFQVYDPATVQEMAWGIAEVSLVSPAEEGENFSPEILIYIEERLKLEGFSKPPRILRQFVPEVDDDSRINDALTMDELDFKAYWDSQELKRLEVEQAVAAGLLEIFKQLNALPLKSADRAGLQGLTQRAEKALAAQSRATRAVAESVPSRPSL